MHALVTGVAGFIGSHLAEALVAGGHTVRGVDVGQQRANLRTLQDDGRFTPVAADLEEAALEPLLDGIDVVFHLAARPGVRSSWGDEFAEYVSANVLVTQRLLEAATGRVQRFVYASSSSVYGDAERYPTPESAV